MSTIESMSAAAAKDFRATVARWTAADLNVPAAIKAESALYASHTEKGFARVVGAAYATHAAYSAGLIGKGKTYDGTQGWANAFMRSPNASKGNVTRWASLGRILVIGKVDPASDEYALIQTKRYETRENLKALIKSETFTAAQVTAAIKADDAAAAKAAAKGRASKTKDEKDAAAKAKDAAAKALDDAGKALPKDAIEAAMRIIDAVCQNPKTTDADIRTLTRRVKSAVDKRTALGVATGTESAA